MEKMGIGIPNRGNRMCKGKEEQKGWTRLENSEMVRVAGAWETQRNMEGGLGGGRLWNLAVQVQIPAPLFYG